MKCSAVVRIQILTLTLAFFLVCSETSCADKPPIQKVEKLNWGKEQEGFAIAISSSELEYLPGDSISLTFTIQNRGEQEDSLEKDISSFRPFVLSMKGPNGREPPKTLYYQFRESAESFTSFIKMEMKHLELYEKTVHQLNRFYDMTLAGEYTLVAKVRVGTRDGSGTVELVSNTLVIRIKEPSQSDEKP